MSTLKVNTITDTTGTTIPNPISLTSNLITLLYGVTWSTESNSTTKLLGSLSAYTTPKTKVVRINVTYTHNGSTNHGYLNGWVFQTGKTYNVSGTFISNAHYDWYFNRFQTELLIPWDPNGTQSVSMYVDDAYNTSASNVYSFYYTGKIDQQ